MLEKFVLITITFQGAALAISFVGLIAVHELKRYLDSPSWNRKQWAWVAFISCQALALGDRIHSPRGTLVSVTYCAILFLSTCGFCDSYRLLLKSLASITIIHLPPHVADNKNDVVNPPDDQNLSNEKENGPGAN